MRVMRPIVAVLLLSVPLLGSARMYQWVNPVSGRVELSGTPPAWYRAESGGPRVQVFEQGQMVDDTAIELPSSESEKLRETAFKEFEMRQQSEQVKKLERAARREATRREVAAAQAEPVPDATSKSDQDAVEAPSDALPEVLDQSTIDRLKGLIQSWDKQVGGGN